MDNALSDDIDYHQFKYFSDIAEHMNGADRVILMTHEVSVAAVWQNIMTLTSEMTFNSNTVPHWTHHTHTVH
jgi:hypothetical protein